jgi:chromosome segregation ATPase
MATPEDMGRPASPQITRERNPGLNGLPSRPTGASDRPRRVPEEDDDGKGSTEHHAKLIAPDAPSGETELDRRIAQLTDELALKSAQLEQTEANAAEEKKRAGLELRELQTKLDESLLSRDQALEQAEANAAEAKKRAGLELSKLQAKVDELLLSRDQALEQAQSVLQKVPCTAEANEQSQRELTEMRAELEASKSESAALRLRLADMENGCNESKAEADTYRTQTATGLVNTDEDRVVHRLMECMQAMEAEIASLRGNEKSFDMMKCSNEE